MDNVQAFFIDASGASQDLIGTCTVSNQKFRVPAGCQAWMPVLVEQASFSFTCADAAALIDVFALNFPVNPYVWGSAGSGNVQNVNVKNGSIAVSSFSPLQINDFLVPGQAVTVTVNNPGAASSNHAVTIAAMQRLVNNTDKTIFVRLGTGAQTAVVTDYPILPGTEKTVSGANVDNVSIIAAAASTGDFYIVPVNYS